jgi:rhombotail lipoprotein
MKPLLKNSLAQHLKWLWPSSLLLLAGCAVFDHRSSSHEASSLLQYLYPGRTDQTVTPSIPTLTLPLRVGVVFVPEGHNSSERTEQWRKVEPLTESFKTGLLQKVSDQFRALPFVGSIEVIPTAYLTPGGGFANLDQVRQMFGVDVIALLSFDQVQSTDQGLLSLTYWTIVGAYLVPAEKNATSTLLDAAVFDVASRKLLFRAPGISHVQGLATPINLAEELRHNTETGFQQASTNLVANLKTELAGFQQRIKDRPEEVKVIRSSGYKAGAGSISLGEAGAALAVCGVAWLSRQKASS